MLYTVQARNSDGPGYARNQRKNGFLKQIPQCFSSYFAKKKLEKIVENPLLHRGTFKS